MKTLFAALSASLLVTVFLARVCAGVDYSWNTDGNGNWADTTKWTPAGFPKDVGDTAFFSGLTAARSITINAAITCSVIRVELDNTSGRANIIGSAPIYLQASSGSAYIQGFSPGSSAYGSLALGQSGSAPPVYLLSPLTVVITNRTLDIYSDFIGDQPITLDSAGAYNTQGTIYMRAACDSPDYTGTVYVTRSVPAATSHVYFENGALKNAAVVRVLGNGVLRVANGAVATIVPPIIAENWAQLYAGARTRMTVSNVTVNGVLRLFLGGPSAGQQATNNLCGVIAGTGTVTCTSSTYGGHAFFVGAISPGYSAGTLILDEAAANVTYFFGTPADTVNLLIEDGDVISNINMGAAIDLANVDVTFLNTTALGTTNWFLYSNSGFSGSFNSENYGTYSGYTVAQGNFIGAVVVPEPLALGVLLPVLLAARRRG